MVTNRKEKRGSAGNKELELTNGKKSLRILKRGKASGERGRIAYEREEERANGEEYRGPGAVISQYPRA